MRHGITLIAVSTKKFDPEPPIYDHKYLKAKLKYYDEKWKKDF